MLNFKKIRPLGAEFSHADKETDRRMDGQTCRATGLTKLTKMSSLNMLKYRVHGSINYFPHTGTHTEPAESIQNLKFYTFLKSNHLIPNLCKNVHGSINYIPHTGTHTEPAESIQNLKFYTFLKSNNLIPNLCKNCTLIFFKLILKKNFFSKCQIYVRYYKYCCLKFIEI